jgi:ribosomal protein L11 methyltransferase
VSRLRPRDWLKPYRNAARPFPVGQSWWIDPHPDEPTAAPPGRVRLVLEPRSAFGSGSHESTQLILVELEAMDLEGRSVLDVGTGSGVLSLAAVARGAAPVLGIDIDPAATMVARETCGRQEWPRRPLLATAETEALAGREFDVVVCNIISSRLIPLLPEVRRVGRRGGEAVLSGLLVIERERVCRELVAVGLAPIAERSAGEWLALRVAYE